MHSDLSDIAIEEDHGDLVIIDRQDDDDRLHDDAIPPHHASLGQFHAVAHQAIMVPR